MRNHAPAVTALWFVQCRSVNREECQPNNCMILESTNQTFYMAVNIWLSHFKYIQATTQLYNLYVIQSRGVRPIVDHLCIGCTSKLGCLFLKKKTRDLREWEDRQIHHPKLFPSFKHTDKSLSQSRTSIFPFGVPWIALWALARVTIMVNSF